MIKLRHGPKMVKGRVEYGLEGLKVKLEEEDPGVASGQFCIFYDGEICLGSAVINDIDFTS